MKLSILLLALCASASLISCKKLDETSLESKQRAELFKAFIVNKNFQVKAYYSDKPVDYITDDTEIRQETDLFAYVSPWIKDDWNVFDVSANTVTVTQNAVKISSNAAESFTKNFSIGTDANGVYFDFLNYQYEPWRYRLVEFTDNHFTVYMNLKADVKVYTTFEVTSIK